MQRLLRAEKEGDDLRAGAGLVGGELAAAHALRDALISSPEDSVRVPGIRRNVAERILRIFQRLGAGKAEEERRNLGAGAGLVRREGVAGCRSRCRRLRWRR